MPLPPGFMTQLWKNQEGYVKNYFSSYDNHYKTGDAGYYDTNKNLYITSWIDDII